MGLKFKEYEKIYIIALSPSWHAKFLFK